MWAVAAAATAYKIEGLIQIQWFQNEQVLSSKGKTNVNQSNIKPSRDMVPFYNSQILQFQRVLNGHWFIPQLQWVVNPSKWQGLSLQPHQLCKSCKDRFYFTTLSPDTFYNLKTFFSSFLSVVSFCCTLFYCATYSQSVV